MIAYLVIALVALSAFMIFVGSYRYHALIEKEKDVFLNMYDKKELLITEKDLDKLPAIMSSYLKKVGVVGSCRDCHSIFKQSGKIRTAKDKKWTGFMATQYMTAGQPGFIWSAKSFPMFIRDKSIDGEGEIKVNMFGYKDVALFTGKKTSISALGRCLGELMYYPIGFLSDAISWETIDNHSVKAKIQIKDVYAEGVFYFNGKGLMVRFQSKRYMADSLEDFTGIANDYKLMCGLYLPTKMKAIWNLSEGDFEYFNATITDYDIV